MSFSNISSAPIITIYIKNIVANKIARKQQTKDIWDEEAIVFSVHMDTLATHS